MEIILKPMETEEELCGKAFVHWKSWQESYSGIVDADYLARMTVARCEESARRWPDNTWVAKDGERVIGFTVPCVLCDENGAQTESGEIRAIYVLEEYQKRGVGYALMQQALKMLADCRVVYVWVLSENQKAISFYKRVGFHADGAEQDYTLGTPVKIIRMALEL